MGEEKQQSEQWSEVVFAVNRRGCCCCLLHAAMVAVGSNDGSSCSKSK